LYFPFWGKVRGPRLEGKYKLWRINKYRPFFLLWPVENSFSECFLDFSFYDFQIFMLSFSDLCCRAELQHAQQLKQLIAYESQPEHM